MYWMYNRGMQGTPHVQSPVGDLEGWLNIPQQYFLAYAYGEAVYGHLPFQTHPVNLITDSTVSIALRHFPEKPDGELGSTTGEAGQAGFWIGQIDTVTGQVSIFCFNALLTWNDDSWTQNTFQVTDNPADWTTVINQLHISPADILSNPQIYGFALVGTGPSAGRMGFDNFAAVPEPTSLIVLAVCGLLIRSRH